MTDEKAKAVARSFVEEALLESLRDDATIDRVYLIPDRGLYVVVVVVEGNKFRVSFPFEALKENPDKSLRGWVSHRRDRRRPGRD